MYNASQPQPLTADDNQSEQRLSIHLCFQSDRAEDACCQGLILLCVVSDLVELQAESTFFFLQCNVVCGY